MTRPYAFLLGVWVVWWVSWLAAAAWRDRAVKAPPHRAQLGYRLLAVAGMMLLFGSYRHQFSREVILWTTPPGISWVLVAVGCVGFAFTWWARIHLGRLWSSNVGRKADHRIVDTGPYGLVRHPIYTGITLASMATAALRGTAAAWVGAGVMTLGWYVKARIEERFLREELGADAYANYERRVPMLVPFTKRATPTRA